MDDGARPAAPPSGRTVQRSAESALPFPVTTGEVVRSVRPAKSSLMGHRIGGVRRRARVQSNERRYAIPTPLAVPVSARSVIDCVSAYSSRSTLVATVMPCS